MTRSQVNLDPSRAVLVRRSLSARAWGSLAVVGASTLGLLLWLPYRFAVTPNFSDSYLFGFNNHVALLIVLGFAVAVGLCTLGWAPAPPAPLGEGSEFRLPRSSLYGALGGMLLASAALSAFTWRLEGMTESIYLIDRLKLVLEGRRPGLDFEFAYGPGMLYGPAWLARGLHLSAAGAYVIFWISLNLAGVLLLYATLQSVDGSFRLRRPAFLFLLLAALTNLFSTGTNYSLFRFVAPCFAAVLVYRLVSRRGSSWGRAMGIFSIAPLYALLLAISPELALAFAGGMCVYLLCFVDLRGAWSGFGFVSLLVALGGTTWLANGSQVFATLNAFRSGGFNFPVVPAPHILLLLVAVGLVSAQRMGGGGRREPSVAVVLTLVSAGSVAAALGRCDPAHVFLDPLGCWVAAFVFASNFPRFGRWFAGVCFATLLLLTLPSLVLGGSALLWKAALPTIFALEPEGSHSRLDAFIAAQSSRLFGPAKAEMKLAEVRFFAHHGGAVDLDRLYGLAPGTIFAAPFGFTPSRFGTLHSPRIDPGFYFGLENVLTPGAVQRKLEEVERHPERPLLMLATQQDSCALDAVRARQEIEGLFFYRYRAEVRNPDSILEPFCTFLRTHYRVAVPASPQNFGYALWRRVPE